MPLYRVRSNFNGLICCTVEGQTIRIVKGQEIELSSVDDYLTNLSKIGYVTITETQPLVEEKKPRKSKKEDS